jgi:hypothetical protein
MLLRKATWVALGAGALGCIAAQAVATAQESAPFTIRKPLEGAHVREKVRIEIPRASIGQGGFVAFYLDPNNADGGTFMLALAPQPSEEDNGQPFTYIWDTKEAKVSDGEHSIKAILYVPASGSPLAMTEKSTTEVHVTVENKIPAGPDVPTSFLLRYKYREGEQLEYKRFGKSVIVGHDSAMGGVRSDVEMMSAKSKLLFSVEDVRFDRDAQQTLALVRNKLTELSILNGGQEYTLDPTALSNSMYQELLPEGRVHYETGATTGLAEFTAQGLPVNNTLELPLMPTLRVSIGDTWTTPGQRLDIPGLPPVLQPVVPLQNKLVDLEYQGGYPCVKIHQSFSGTLASTGGQLGQKHDAMKSLPFGGMLITSPTLTFDRDIFIAYNSGTLVRTGRTLIIKGRTTANTDGAAPGSQGMAGKGGGMMGPGTGGMMGGSGGRMGMGGSGGKMGGPMGPGTGGMMGGSGGRMGPGGGKMGGMMGPGFGGGSGGQNRMGPGNSGGGIMRPGGMGGGSAGSAGPGEADHPITIRSTTDTDLLKQTGASAPAAHAASMKSISGKKSK